MVGPLAAGGWNRGVLDNSNSIGNVVIPCELRVVLVSVYTAA